MERHLYYYNQHSAYLSDTSRNVPNVSYCKLENEVHYNPISHDYKKDYFTIESLEDNNTIYLKASNSAITKTVSASTDNGTTWAEYTSSIGGSGTTLATLNAGDKLLVKGENSAYATSISRYNQFKSTGQIEIKGNIMSLVNGDSFVNADELTRTNTFCSLFRVCTGLISAENLMLPATTLAESCYQYMFADCTSLTTAPELPATTLAERCYDGMFNGCTSLTTAPELPATTLARECYRYMFSNCTSLTTAPELSATTLAGSCYEEMFSNCTSLTTEAVVPNVVKPVSGYYCCGMYLGCDNVTPSSDYDSAAYNSCEEEEEE